MTDDELITTWFQIITRIEYRNLILGMRFTKSTLLSTFPSLFWDDSITEFDTEFNIKVELPCRHRLLDKILIWNWCTIRSKSWCRHSNSTFVLNSVSNLIAIPCQKAMNLACRYLFWEKFRIWKPFFFIFSLKSNAKDVTDLKRNIL